RYGLLGLKRWLEQAGVPVRSLRQRYTALAGLAPTAGHLLIAVTPQRFAARRRELVRLGAWLRAGNHILLLAALNDWPDWRLGLADRGGLDHGQRRLEQLLGLSTKTVRPCAEDGGVSPFGAPRERSRHARPMGRHPVLDGVARVTLRAPIFDCPLQELRVLKGRAAIPVLEVEGHGLPMLWMLRLGPARAWAMSYSDAFGNYGLEEADNARLFANILSLSLAPGAAVVFDDFHQGLSTLYDPQAFFRDPRLHTSVAFLLGFWLLWVLGHGNRFGPARSRVQHAGAADWARAMGGLLARRLTPRAAAERLIEQFQAELRRRYGLSADAPAWQRLEQGFGIDRQALAALRAERQALQENQAPDLVRLCNLLGRVRKGLP
ncbi:MAG: DUF4350 domain-containing protein, partial [Gammaproteobacteria bacterium]